MKLSTLALSVSLAAAVPVTVGAQTAADLNNQVTTMNNLAANQGQSHVIGKISSDFSSFLGSDATAVVTGLRNGTPITLTSTTPNGTPVTTTTVITPPTDQMGFGEVYISLALAKQQLSTLGITQPTPEQLQAALTGGTITQTDATGAITTTEVPGILALRSDGMGWGQIAQQKLGVKLGSVMSAMKSGNKSLAVSSTPASKGSVNASSTGNTGSSSKGGVVSASAKAQASSSAAASSGNKGGNSGIVSASGRASGNAYSHGSNSGIVTGAGRSVGAGGGVVSPGGSGNSAGRGKASGK